LPESGSRFFTSLDRKETEQAEKLKADLRSADQAVDARTLIFLLAACGNILFLGWAYPY
jgi:hypothetical protein